MDDPYRKFRLMPIFGTQEQPPKCKVDGCENRLTYSQMTVASLVTPETYQNRFPELENLYGPNAWQEVCIEHIREVQYAAGHLTAVFPFAGFWYWACTCGEKNTNGDPTKAGAEHDAAGHVEMNVEGL